jgi:hypothetical protein
MTVELPLPVDDFYYNTLSPEELRRRSSINTEVASTMIHNGLSYVLSHHAELVAAQVETFRRGAAGEPLRSIPDGFVPGFGPEDRSSTTFPRAYTIPGKSDVATARLVNQLVAQDIQVGRTDRASALGPAGTYVVDMHQPKRGLANVLLEAGSDLTTRTQGLTDTGAWSLAL